MTSTDDAEWSVFHFSQSNPVGAEQANISKLLIAVASTLEQMEPVDVQDIVMHNEPNAGGDWYSLTVYYQKRE